MKPIQYFYRQGIPLVERGVGLFKLGDTFQTEEGIPWTIVEVVNYGRHPTPHPRLRIEGYYRKQESYVIEDQRGNRRWPYVGTLLKMKRCANKLLPYL